MVMIPNDDKAAIKRIITGVLMKGHRMMCVDNGEELLRVRTIEDAVDEITSVDEARIYFRTATGERAWIYFVLGNEPIEVAADWTVNINEAVTSIVDPWWD